VGAFLVSTVWKVYQLQEKSYYAIMMPMNFRERKKKRTEIYKNNIEGWKLKPCAACGGSGRYDNKGSPKCAACDGTGKERYNSKDVDLG